VERLAMGRLADPAEAPASGEQVHLVVPPGAGGGGGVVVEHVQSGSLSAPVPYEQEHSEWALVLRGAAVLAVEGRELHLAARDWVWLPAGTPHVLVSTEPGTEWLTVRWPV